jgi:hypothetical protein
MVGRVCNKRCRHAFYRSTAPFTAGKGRSIMQDETLSAQPQIGERILDELDESDRQGKWQRVEADLLPSRRWWNEARRRPDRYG